MSLLEATGIALHERLLPTDLTVEAGERIALIGPNGGGKTSLLRAIAQVEEARGEVRTAGRPIAEQRRAIAFMSADRAARWPIPVGDLVRIGHEEVGHEAVAQMLDRFELAPMAGRPADRLSTGEQARVAMARVLLSPAQVLLLDEPLANLDPWWIAAFLEAIEARAKAGSAVLCALHDLSRLDRFDRAILVDGKKVTADGKPAAVTCSTAFEAAFRMDAATAGVRLADRRSSQ